jgi:decaprenylphospho-beta-D-ribofuranose 2-oxidase
VTVGGAIAADIHGKNHHRDGSFCDHLESFVLLTPAGERMEVKPGDEAFEATAGGMGLTGVIVSARLRVQSVESALMLVDTERANDLDDLLSRLRATDADHRYSVAWIDCVARGRSLGRAVLMSGDHASPCDLPASRRDAPLTPPPGAQLAAPPWVPSGLLNRATVRAFNEAYFRRAPVAEHGRVQSLHAFFFPLDAVRGWNRLYGSRGFVQYQCLLPFGAEDTLRAVLERLSSSGAPASLAVLKAMGPGRGLLSFPGPGWTLALDIPVLPWLARPLDELDELVAEAGGRVYLAKDSRVRPDLLRSMYPELPRWEEIRARLDPGRVMRSDLARRLALGAAEPAR